MYLYTNTYIYTCNYDTHICMGDETVFTCMDLVHEKIVDAINIAF